MNPKADEEKMLFPLNRRSFLYNTAVGAGAVLLWNGCAGAPSTQDRDTLKEIKAIWEKEPSDPKDALILRDILLPWMGAPDDEIRDEAVRALALLSDISVFPTYKELFRRHYADSTFVRNIIPLFALNYTVNPAARGSLLFAMYTLSTQIAPRATAKPLDLPDWAKAQANTALQFLGNVSLRGNYIKYYKARTSVNRSDIAVEELRSRIEAIDPSFKEQVLKAGNITLWRAQLSSDNDEDKIRALRNLHRLFFVKSKLLLGMLKNASLKLQEAIIPLLGNNFAFTPEIVDVMLNYLDGKNDNLVVAAAKALRFKENLPAKKIAKILERHRKGDPILGQQLDDILLSTLVSEDAALEDVFAALVWNMSKTEPDNKKDKIMRLNEMRIWYWRLSNNGMDRGYPIGKSNDTDCLVYESSDTRDEPNNRNDRVRLAIPSVPYDIQNLFIAFLRQIPAITGPTEKHYEDRFARDLKDFQEIRELLSSNGILFMSETNDTVRKSLIVAAASLGNALSERPSMDTDGKPTRAMGFVRRWSATKAAANNNTGANIGFEAEFT